MWIVTAFPSKAWVSWRPPQTKLHYVELYRAIWEYLRMPPARELEARARDYLRVLLDWPHTELQRDRILWVRAWIDGIPMEEERRKRVGDATYRLLTVVCYQPPGMGAGLAKLRAG
jgi:hypothetical protein